MDNIVQFVHCFGSVQSAQAGGGCGSDIMDIDSNSNSNGSANLMEHSNNDACEITTECEITKELSAKVFENDMLRDMIIKYVLYTSNDLSRSDLKNVRLVRKCWLRTAADALRKSRDPTFILSLNTSNSLEGCPYVHETGSKLLHQFVLSLTSSCRVPEFHPTYSLKLRPEFFLRENYQDFSDCLVSCGDSLVELELLFPINSSMTFVFHSFYLPQLKRLAVQFSEQRLMDVSTTVIHNNGHTIYPLQTILNGTDELTELHFKYTPSEAYIPFGFEYLGLPQTITALYLDCPMKSSDLQLLIKNDLPNLKSLRLFATNVPYADELIFNILEKYRTTLTVLGLKGHHYQGRVRNTTLFRFPLMEKLKTVTITSQCWQFEEDLTHLERQLPSLNELRMLNTSESMFVNWTENSKYEGVLKLFVSLINVSIASYQYHPHHVEVPMTITLEKMQGLHLAFPNVVCLELTIWGPQTCGLKYLFMEMRSLQKLAINLKGSGEHFHPVHWDSLLVGVPPDMVSSFRKNPDFWNMVELKDDNNFPSIRKLSELRTLALVESLSTSPTVDSNTPLISDLTFHYAFLQMPNLKHLLLHGRFSPSPQMSDRWMKEKGVKIHGMRGH